jgi:hypothetical protein
LHRTSFLSCTAPHYLMIIFPYSTLRVISFSSSLLTSHTFQPVPPSIKPPPSLRYCLSRS